MKTRGKLILTSLLIVAQLLGSAMLALASPPTSWLAQTDEEAAAMVAELKTAIPVPIHDTFRTESGWEVAENENGHRRFYGAGAYHLYSAGASSTDDGGVIGLSDITVSDFLVEVDAFPPTGQVNTGFGIVFRYVDENNAYFFGLVNTEGENSYQLVKSVDGTRELMAEQAAPAATDQASVTTLSLIAEGDTIVLLADGEVIDHVVDDTFGQGSIGLAAFAQEESIVSFDDFKLWRYEDMADEELSEAGGADALVRLETIRQAAPAFADDFSDDENGWYTQSEAGVDFVYSDDAFQIAVADTDTRAFSGNEQIYNLADDFLLEVDVQALTEGVYEYGVVFRAQDTENYFFFGLRGIDTAVVAKVIDGSYSNLIETTMSASMADAAPAYRLGLLLEGSDYTFLVNDEVVATITDATFSGRTWSLVVQSGAAEGVAATFDNLTLWTLPAATPDPQALTLPDPEALAAEITAIREADPILSDEFRRDTGQWTSLTEGGASAVRDRTYHLEITDESVFNYVTHQTLDSMTLTNYLVEVDTEVVGGSPSNNYGLVFRRVDNQNYYAFTVVGTQFRLVKLIDGQWEILIDYTESTAIDDSQGAINRLGVLVVGEQITLLINEVGVAQLEDATFAEGIVGLAAGTFDDSGLEVAFDNFDLWIIE